MLDRQKTIEISQFSSSISSIKVGTPVLCYALFTYALYI